MEEALFRDTITLANLLVWLKLIWYSFRCLAIQIAVKILTVIKLKVEAGQRQH